MYNAEQKDRFIKAFTTSEKARADAKRIFDLLEPSEEAAWADLCTMDADLLRPILGKVSGFRSGSAELPMRILRGYARWCQENRIPGACDGLLRVKSVGAENVAKRTVKNPRGLQVYLDLICEKESEETADNVIRAFAWLAYAGMKDEDIFLVRTGDVDLENLKVVFNGVSYPIYPEALPAIKNCVTLSGFSYKHPNYPVRILPRISGDLLLRSIRSVPELQSMRVNLSRRGKKAMASGKTERLLSYYGIWLSGVFYRMHEEELASDLPPDFQAFVNSTVGSKLYKLDSGNNTQEAKRRQLAREYLADYVRWKQTLL